MRTQFWVLVLLLSGTLAVMKVRGSVDSVPESTPLAQFPVTVGTWTGRDIPIEQDVLDILGNGIFLSRLYTPGLLDSPSAQSEASPSVGLFVAYFPTQRTGQSIHSPQNCLPGAGWTFESSGVTEFSDKNGKIYRVGDYVISNGSSRDEVLYWYQSHGRTIANDYVAKLEMITDSIRTGRSDAALVRIITPVESDRDRSNAHNRIISFAQLVVPQLPAYVPN